jgi:hypothetical protein
VARKLAEELRTHGAAVWIDEEELAVGDSLAARIESAIRDSDLFLILISPASERSQWLTRELGLALGTNNRTRVVPVVLPGATVPSDPSDILYLSANPDDFAKAAERILGASHGINDEASVVAAAEGVFADLKVDWQRKPSIAGVRPDLLVEGQDGTRIVVEIKGRPKGTTQSWIARSSRCSISSGAHPRSDWL